MRTQLLLLSLFVGMVGRAAPTSWSLDTLLMGVDFTFTAVHDTRERARSSVRAGVKEAVRIQYLISSWDSRSQTSMINAAAGEVPVVVDKELFQLIERCKKVSELSNGSFDISFASIDHIWDFSAITEVRAPAEADILRSVQLIDHRNIILDHEMQSVFLAKKGMKIGFGAIGKGYAADQAKKVMVATGAESGVINAGGDLLGWGQRPDGEAWKVGITAPEQDDGMIAWADVRDMAIVTSGSYKKFVLINGERYCHIIDPKTGWPVKGLLSVSVITESAELADALATTVFVLGRQAGLALVDQMNGVECIVLDDTEQMFFSKGIDRTFVRYDQ